MRRLYFILIFLAVLSLLKGETELSPVLKDAVGMGYETTLPSDKLRLYWQNQGGKIRYFDVGFNYMGAKMEFATSDTTSSKLLGGGIGNNGSINYLYFLPPDYTQKRYYSFAAKAGVGYLMNLSFYKMNTGFDFQAYSFSENKLIDYHVDYDYSINRFNFDIGPTLGVNLGLGTFPVAQKWYGAVFGVTWRPTFTLSSTNTVIVTTSDHYMFFGRKVINDSDSSINLGTFEYSIDFGSIKAMTEKLAPRASLKINFIYIPPVGDHKVTAWMLGIGASKFN